MKRKLFEKLGAIVLSGVLLFGAVSGPMAPLPTAAAVEAAERSAASAQPLPVPMPRSASP